VRLLAIGLRRHEDVHADLEPRRLVNDLVAACPRREPALDGVDVEEVLVDRRHQTAACFSSGMIESP
jgi:hypothetical protein